MFAGFVAAFLPAWVFTNFFAGFAAAFFCQRGYFITFLLVSLLLFLPAWVFNNFFVVLYKEVCIEGGIYRLSVLLGHNRDEDDPPLSNAHHF